MITGRIGRHKVMLPISHNLNKINDLTSLSHYLPDFRKIKREPVFSHKKNPDKARTQHANFVFGQF